ncbi:MAG: cytochrome c [Roseivivax sp.]|nr:cytochrome c [Roseivivax sp.]
MRRLAILAAAGAVLSGGAGWLLLPGMAGNRTDPVQAGRVADGRALYAEHCAACHGADLSGAPDWQTPGADGKPGAPPHDATGHTWHHGDALLFDYVKNGGQVALRRRGVDYDSGMPGFGDALSDAQIEDILAFIRSTWTDEIRAFQAQRTREEG